MSAHTVKHPIFPHGMELDVRLAIGDELDVTHAGYPMNRAASSREHALTVYAEQLGGFTAADVRDGFRLARSKAETFAPSPTLVRRSVAEARNARVARQQQREESTVDRDWEPLTPDAIPDWRAQLRGFVAQIGNGPQPKLLPPRANA